MRTGIKADRALRALVPVLVGLLSLLGACVPAAHAQTDETFKRFLAELWPEAKAMGVTRRTFDAAFKGVSLDLALPDLVIPGKTEHDAKGQAEFTRTPAEYLNNAQLARLAAQAVKLRREHASELERIEREIGVEPQFVLAIWGRETAFGAHKLSYDAIQALANQAYLGRRKDLFRTELLNALKMLEAGIPRERMRSSWAGALGLTQFMPSEYFTTAYDLDGDGRKDIWSNVGDALASAANQLKQKGWVKGLTWGYEVILPKGTSCLMEGPDHVRPLRQWIAEGVVRTGGRKFPPHALDQAAFILTPGGGHGPAFLALENFMVIKRYNMSDLYALFVGNLGDRIAGGGPFDTPWTDVKQMPAKGIGEIQERLRARGQPVAKVDGKAGMNTRSLIGIYQRDHGLAVDCWPTERVLSHLRGSSPGAQSVPKSAPKSVDAR
ncbi:MAG: lytic murein transglycosylase [Hyphomicrobiaceae bacterium]|nr:lytic murein transglycosylase [Hyphomicrobiaceae bacterium]